MQPDVQMIVRAEELAKALEYLSGVGAGKNPEVKTAMKDAARFLINQGRQRLSSRHKDTGGLEKRMIYEIFRNKKGVKVGFENNTAGAGAWYGMKPWIYDLGSYKGVRHTRKGYNRGVVRGSKFWTDTNATDSDQAMQMVNDAIQRSIQKLVG